MDDYLKNINETSVIQEVLDYATGTADKEMLLAELGDHGYITKTYVSMVLSVIILIYYLILFFLNKKNFKCFDKKSAKYGWHSRVTFWFSLFFLAFTLLTSVAISFFSFKSKTEINKQFSLDSLVKKLDLGDEEFAGISTIEKFLERSSNAVITVAKNGEKLFSKHNEIDELAAEFKLLVSQLKDYSEIELSNPTNPDGKKVSPRYTKLFGPHEDSLMTSIEKEYNAYISKNYENHKQLHESIAMITSNKDEITQNIESAKVNIGKFASSIEGFNSKVNEMYIEEGKKEASRVLLVTLIVSVVYSFIIVLLLVSSCIYVKVKDDGVGSCMSFLWNSLVFLVIILVLLNGIIVIFSFMLSQTPPAINHIVKEASPLLNECINGNGDIAPIIKTETTEIKLINVFFLKSEAFKKLVPIPPSKVFPKAKEIINEFLEDYTKSTPEITNALNQINSKSKECMSRDVWVSNKSKCPEGYMYLPKSDIESSSDENRYCLIIQDDFGDDEILFLYGHKCPTRQLLKELAAAVSSASNFYNENEKYLFEIHDTIENLSNVYTSLTGNIESQRKSVDSLLQKIPKLQSMKGRSNCQFAKARMIETSKVVYEKLVPLLKMLEIAIFGTAALYFFVAPIINFLIVSNSESALKNYRRFRKNLETGKGVELVNLDEEFEDDDDDELDEDF